MASAFGMIGVRIQLLRWLSGKNIRHTMALEVNESMSGLVQGLLIDWYCRAKFSQYAHYESAKLYERLNYSLGFPVIILSAFVGTSVFVSLGKSVNPVVQIAIGLVSVSTAALASLQTFLRFSEKAEASRIAGARYGALRREIQEILVFDTFNKKDVSNIRGKIDELATDVPHLPSFIWSRRKVIMDEYRKKAYEELL